MPHRQINLNLIHYNARSLNKNFDKLCEDLHLLKFPFSVIGVTETWINNSSINFSLPGYSFYQENRIKGLGGGVGLFVKETVNVRVLPEIKLSVDGVNSLFVDIIGKNKKITIVGVIYRKPSSNINDFIDSIDSVLNVINRQSKTCFIMGDFNLDILQYNQCNMIQNDLDTFFSMGFSPTINKPTRVSSTSATIIDNIFTNSMDHNSVSGILLSDLSDHYPVFHLSSVIDTNQDYKNNSSFVRHITPSALQSLSRDLSNTDC